MVVKPTGRKSCCFASNWRAVVREMGLVSFPEASHKTARQDASTKRNPIE
ncbi:hypothetical protein [Pseudomonas viciae]